MALIRNDDEAAEFKRAYTRASDAGHDTFMWKDEEVSVNTAFWILTQYYQSQT